MIADPDQPPPHPLAGQEHPTSAHPSEGVLAALLTKRVGAPLVAAAAVVIVAALATATALRPARGFTSNLHLLGALGLGASASLLALLAAAALTVAARRRSGRQAPLLRAFALPMLAAALLLAASLQALRTAAAPSTAAVQSSAAADFARWQQQVVPIIVSYVSVVRGDAALLRKPPRTLAQQLQGRKHVNVGTSKLRRAAATLAAAARTTATDARLVRLTRQLQTSLALARQAQVALATALARTAEGQPPRRTLLAPARHDLRRSQQAMASVTLEANMLGGQLNAQP